MHKLALIGAALVGVCLVAQLARAEPVYVDRSMERYARRHFYLGVEAVGVAVLHESGPRAFLQSGGGLNLFIGGRVHPALAIEFGWQPTFHTNQTDIFGRPIATLGLDALTVDFKVFPFHGFVQPYFLFGVGGYMLGDNLSVFAAGPGYQTGVGIDFWVARWASLGLKGQYRGVELFDYDANRNNTYVSLLTGSVNFTGRF